MNLRKLSDLYAAARRRAQGPYICPYDLGPLEGGALPQCAVCGQTPPPLYLASPAPILPIQVFGFKGHGKSMFLAALVRELDSFATCVAVTDEAQALQASVRADAMTGRLPDWTPLGAAPLYVFQLAGLPQAGSRTLVARDEAGETFRNMNVPVDRLPFLLRASLIFMIISLPDLRQSPSDSMDLLMTNLVNTLVQHRVDLRRENRGVIAVLTKADLIDDLPASLHDYLADGSLADVGSPRYMAGMQRMNAQARDWLKKDGPSRAFIQQAAHHNLWLRFALVSATGAPVVIRGEEAPALECAWQPHRVLDPFLWALRVDSPQSPSRATFLGKELARLRARA